MRAMHELVETLRVLRGDSGCPWDRSQSLADLCRHLIDEAYELQDAAAPEDAAAAAEELGDVLFMAFSCGLFLEENGGSDLERVAVLARDKIVRRHPHVFGDAAAKTSDEVVRQWRTIKEDEARARGEEPPRWLANLPRSLPALRRAVAVQRKVAEVGFEWETAEQVHAKLIEETRELGEVLGDPARMQDELGDILFSAVNLSRFLGIDPEVALQSTVRKFVRRFDYVEERLRDSGRALGSATLSEMDALWEESKRLESSPDESAP